MAKDSQEEVKGLFRYEQDSKRFHRFRIETGEGITGCLYIPKELTPMPKKLVFEYKRED